MHRVTQVHAWFFSFSRTFLWFEFFLLLCFSCPPPLPHTTLEELKAISALLPLSPPLPPSSLKTVLTVPSRHWDGGEGTPGLGLCQGPASAGSAAWAASLGGSVDDTLGGRRSGNRSQMFNRSKAVMGSMRRMRTWKCPVLALGPSVLRWRSCLRSGTFRKCPRPRRDPAVMRQENNADRLESWAPEGHHVGHGILEAS